MTSNNNHTPDIVDSYDEAIADIATTIAAELGVEWGLDWADDIDLTICWIKIAQYVQWIISRNLGNLGETTDSQWQRITKATGLTSTEILSTYPPEPLF